MKSTFVKIAQCLAIALVMTIAAPSVSAQSKKPAQSQPAAKNKTYSTSFYFSNGNSKSIEKSQYSKTSALMNFMKANPSAKVEITGWASTSGKPEANKQASIERAETIKRYLVGKGVNPKQIKTKGMGCTTTKNPRRADVVAVAKK